jgi:hypothetical protein
MKTSERSRKAREAKAESLLKVSNSLITAFFVTILILPMAAVVKSVFESTSNVPFSLSSFLTFFFSWKMWVFIACEYGVIHVAQTFRKKALDIYDELYPDSTGADVLNIE